jgi:hypothetical protein
MRSKNSPNPRHKTGTAHQTPAPKGQKKTAQDEVQDVSPDEVLGNPRKNIQAPQGSNGPRPKSVTEATMAKFLNRGPELGRRNE